jgi:hypothetical protein
MSCFFPQTLANQTLSSGHTVWTPLHDPRAPWCWAFTATARFLGARRSGSSLIGRDHKHPRTLDKKVLEYRTPLISCLSLGTLLYQHAKPA